jgi:hypothetical protein
MPLLYTKDPVKPRERVEKYKGSSGKRLKFRTIQPGISFASKV